MLNERDPLQFVQAMIDALTSSICVVDETGSIILVNKGWRTLVSGYRNAQGSSGDNYFTFCDTVFGAEAGLAARTGIRAVLAGKRNNVLLEYSNHALRKERCLTARASRVAGQKLALIAHERTPKGQSVVLSYSEEQPPAMQSAEEISDLYNSAPCGYHCLDENGWFVRINDTELKWLGYTREEIVGKKRIADLLSPRSAHVFEENYPGFKARGWVRDLEFEMVRKDGSILPVLLNATAITDAQGQFVLSRSTIVDLTERKRIEAELRKAKEQLEQRVIERTAELVRANEALRQDNAARRRAEAHWAALLTLAQRLNSATTLEAAARIVVEVADALLGWDACAFFFQEGDKVDLVLLMDTIAGGKVDTANPYFGPPTPLIRSVLEEGAKLILRTEAQISDSELVPFGDTNRRSASLMFVPVRVESRTVGVLTIQSYTPNAYTHEDLKTLQALADHCVGAIERTRANEKIGEQAALIDQAHDAILIRDLEGVIRFWSRGAERLYGWTAQEAVGRKATELHNLEAEPFQTAFEHLLRHGNWMGELTQRAKDGRKLVIDCRWTLMRDGQGNPKAVLAINADITTQKHMEAQLLRAQRMESLGTLTSGIAHDLNNILAPILMGTHLLRTEVQSIEGIKTLSSIQASAQRGSDIIKQLLIFGRGSEAQRMPMNPARLIKELIKLFQETFPKNLTLKAEIPNGLWTICANPTQVHQVLMNLCVNARDAMPEGGVLSLRAENIQIDETYARITPKAKPGPHVVFAVRDSGSGIDPEHLPKIFDPFFTTKGVGKGTGLGLSVVLGIAESHGGFVNVYSQPGLGTEFKVYLPALPDQVAESERAPVSPLPGGHGELILIVDDEPSIRGVLSRMLEMHGYGVVAAGDGVEALRVFTTLQHKIKLVISDLAMPAMGGVALVEALRTSGAQTKIIISTGLGCEADVQRLKALGVDIFLEKPYSASMVLQALQQALG